MNITDYEVLAKAYRARIFTLAENRRFDLSGAAFSDAALRWNVLPENGGLESAL